MRWHGLHRQESWGEKQDWNPLIWVTGSHLPCQPETPHQNISICLCKIYLDTPQKIKVNKTHLQLKSLPILFNQVFSLFPHCEQNVFVLCNRMQVKL